MLLLIAIARSKLPANGLLLEGYLGRMLLIIFSYKV